MLLLAAPVLEVAVPSVGTLASVSVLMEFLCAELQPSRQHVKLLGVSASSVGFLEFVFKVQAQPHHHHQCFLASHLDVRVLKEWEVGVQSMELQGRALRLAACFCVRSTRTHKVSPDIFCILVLGLKTHTLTLG